MGENNIETKMMLSQVGEICGVRPHTVSVWIAKGYLKATKNGKGKGHYEVSPKDLREFMLSEHFVGHPEQIFIRKFGCSPDVEECYPVNFLIAVLGINRNSEDEKRDIWDYDIRSLKQLIGRLTDKEQKVISLRYQFGMSLDETGIVFGVTRERVRQIIEKAERKLRTWINSGEASVIGKEKYDRLQRNYNELQIKYGKLLERSSNVEAFDPEEFGKDIPIETLDIDVRTRNCLRRARIYNLHEIIEFDKNPGTSWLCIRNFGCKCLGDLANAVYLKCGYDIRIVDDSPEKVLRKVRELDRYMKCQKKEGSYHE